MFFLILLLTSKTARPLEQCVTSGKRAASEHISFDSMKLLVITTAVRGPVKASLYRIKLVESHHLQILESGYTVRPSSL